LFQFFFPNILFKKFFSRIFFRGGRGAGGSGSSKKIVENFFLKKIFFLQKIFLKKKIFEEKI